MRPTGVLPTKDPPAGRSVGRYHVYRVYHVYVFMCVRGCVWLNGAFYFKLKFEVFRGRVVGYACLLVLFHDLLARLFIPFALGVRLPGILYGPPRRDSP